MAALVGRRAAVLVAVLFAVTFLAFSAMNFLGDPLVNVVGPLAELDCEGVAAGTVADTSVDSAISDCETVAAARAVYHLDRAVPVRYVLWLRDLVTGNLGTSFENDQPVNTIIRERLPETLILLGMAQVVSLGIAIPWGVVAAYRANRAFDRTSTVASFGLLSVPNFAMGVILLYWFSLGGWPFDKWPLKYLAVFPSAYDSGDVAGLLFSMVLPAFTLGLPLAASYQRLLRTDLITTLQEDFVHMARAKGLPPLRIMFRHALRPSLFSVVTVFGVSTGALIGGSLVVERIYGIPGVGSAIVEAVIRDDFPVVLAMVVVIASAFVVINFVVDILYSWLDPRVRTK